jgi:LAGLIDADG DNA endonuclease family
MVKIPNNLNSIILGIILSDGHLRKNKLGNTYLSFKQTIKRFELTWILFLKFSHFCQGYPRLDYTTVNGKRFTLIIFVTRVYPCFTEWHNMFYVNGKKIIPLELYNMLDYEALAYWIIGDGTKSGNGMVLQTQSFTIKDWVFIISVLMHKFDLNCSLYMQRNQPTIYINSKSMKKIKHKLIPYFPISMQYKL